MYCMHYLLPGNKSHPKLSGFQRACVVPHSSGEIQEQLCWVPLAQGLPEVAGRSNHLKAGPGLDAASQGLPRGSAARVLGSSPCGYLHRAAECSRNMAAGFLNLSNSGDSKEQATGPFWTFAFFLILFIWSKSLSPVPLWGRQINSTLWRECQESVDTIATVKGFWCFLKSLSGLGTEKLRMGRTELATTSGPIRGDGVHWDCVPFRGRDERGRLQPHQKCLSFYFAAPDLTSKLGRTAEN